MKIESMPDSEKARLVPSELSCVIERKIDFISHHRSYNISSNTTNKEPGLYKKHYKLINQYILENSQNNEICKNKYRLDIEITNGTVKENIILGVFNIITLGIIPNWNNDENTMRLIFYDQNGDKRIYVSKTNYSSTRSILFLPITFFFTSSEVELDLIMIPYHLNHLVMMKEEKLGNLLETKP